MGFFIRPLTAAGLGVDAYVHLHLAGDMGSSGGAVGKGTLFVIQGIVAAAVALVVLAWPRRATYAAAFLVAASALGVVLLYRYVDVGAIGPLPDMYEPVWYPEKVVTTVAEAVATVTALTGLALTRTSAATEPARHPTRVGS